MDALEQLRGAIPDAAKDIRLNLQAVLRGGALSEAQRWGVAAAAAVAARHARLREAVLAAALTAAGADVVEDAKAAAALMAMNNVYYRFRHMVGKPIYGEKPAGLRMNRLMQPATNRTDFELMALAVSAINGCARPREDGDRRRAHPRSRQRRGADRRNDLCDGGSAGGRGGGAGAGGLGAGRLVGTAQRSGCDGAVSCTRRRARSASSMARRAWVSASRGK